jgi:transcriptional regulator with AAA-type ATPase domain
MTTTRRFVDGPELAVLQAFEVLVEGNPFTPERVAAERQALGADHVAHGEVWHVDVTSPGSNANEARLRERGEALAKELRSRLASGARASAEELAAYRCLVYFVLFERFRETFFAWIGQIDGDVGPGAAALYGRYRRDFEHLMAIPGVELPDAGEESPAHVFALGYQIRRAFHHTYRGIYGGSLPAANLRASVWQSIFTHDARRYRRGLHGRMSDITTLVLGQSGTGKELVARAVGLAAYIPFDEERKRFAEPAASMFRPVNLAALSSSLIESELFGHRRGAFTGALEDRIGWLEECPRFGTVFLDEIGELEAGLQTKLLRVLQGRSFQRVGETRERRFEGRIVAATNRDLAGEIAAGRFRVDLYYRLCADVIRTPTLAEQIAAAPQELENLVLILARRVVSLDEANGLAEQVVAWIDANLGRDYTWPGNVRELEQCLRNVLVRGSYHPLRLTRASAEGDAFLEDVEYGRLSADELMRSYCRRIYEREGTFEGAARALGLDRRTVKAYLAPATPGDTAA